MKHAGWPDNLRTAAQPAYALRITKTAKAWILENEVWPRELSALIEAAPPRADDAAQVVLSQDQLRKLWWYMDDMLEQMTERKYTPGVNSALGMQRKAEALVPSLPW